MAAGVKVQGRADPLERVGEHRHQRLPLVGERQPARQAAEQGCAQPPLQHRYLMADRALADAQLDRGAGEVQVPRRRLEGAQRVQGELGAVHVPAMRSIHGSVEN